MPNPSRVTAIYNYLSELLGPGDHGRMAEHLATWDFGSPQAVLRAVATYKQMGDDYLAPQE